MKNQVGKYRFGKKLIGFISLFIITIPVAMADDDGATYRVTITNATNHQVITPPLIATHRSRYYLFNIGDTASDGLALLAETGDNSLLSAEVSSERSVHNVVAGAAPIFPGESASFEIRSSKKGKLSMAAMLATTNDAFAGLNSVSLPKKRARYLAYVYDAGSEMNNEDCAYIPGPPCAPDSGNLRTETGEGFIAIHNGVHGGSSLNPKQLDWRGPAVAVTITRIKD